MLDIFLSLYYILDIIEQYYFTLDIVSSSGSSCGSAQSTIISQPHTL